jgi:hypothetical protein
MFGVAVTSVAFLGLALLLLGGFPQQPPGGWPPLAAS